VGGCAGEVFGSPGVVSRSRHGKSGCLPCQGIVNEPFAVINADDYYGKEAFVKVHGYLSDLSFEKSSEFCMAGFKLKNTLSENGGVTRGVCSIDKNGMLIDVVETHNIIKIPFGPAICQENGTLP